MAAALNWNAKVVVDEHGAEHPLSAIVVRSNVATLRGPGGAVISERADVAAVRAVPGDSKRRDIEFEDGTRWEVTRRTGGCGCGH